MPLSVSPFRFSIAPLPIFSNKICSMLMSTYLFSHACPLPSVLSPLLLNWFEVRAIGKILNLVVGFLKRHPGPGLVVQILGDITKGNGLDITHPADEIFIQSIKDAGLYDNIWQTFVILLPDNMVGVQGDQRTYGHVVALRAVTSQDGMLADWHYFAH